MYRIFEVRAGTRRQIGDAMSLRDAQAFVVRAAGNPLIAGSAMGSYRGPNEFLPRQVTGAARFEIIEEPDVPAGDRSTAA